MIDQEEYKWRDSREQVEQRMMLAQAIAALTPRQRQAVILFAHGLTQREIGEVLGISQQKVCSLLQRAIKNLRVGVKTANFSQTDIGA